MINYTYMLRLRVRQRFSDWRTWVDGVTTERITHVQGVVTVAVLGDSEVVVT